MAKHLDPVPVPLNDLVLRLHPAALAAPLVGDLNERDVMRVAWDRAPITSCGAGGLRNTSLFFMRCLLGSKPSFTSRRQVADVMLIGCSWQLGGTGRMPSCGCRSSNLGQSGSKRGARPGSRTRTVPLPQVG